MEDSLKTRVCLRQKLMNSNRNLLTSLCPSVVLKIAGVGKGKIKKDLLPPHILLTGKYQERKEERHSALLVCLGILAVGVNAWWLFSLMLV